jgi:hypothetical protein
MAPIIKYRTGEEMLKGTVSQEFLIQVFFLNHLPTNPLKITLGSF